MSVWLDIAHDGGYRGEEQLMVAQFLEHRARQETEEAAYYAALEEPHLSVTWADDPRSGVTEADIRRGEQLAEEHGWE